MPASKNWMFYAASKITFFLLQPSSLALIILGAGLALVSAGWHARLGLRLSVFAFLYLLVGGLSPLGNVLILPLEQRFPAWTYPAEAQTIKGIIILGGFEEPWVSRGRNNLAINEAAERLIESAVLAKRLPAAKVVFTGGVGGLIFKGQDAAGSVGAFFSAVGVAPERIVLEGNSRNTHENAEFTRALLSPAPGDRWLLVTSAYHMPRSVGVFRRAGFTVEAVPVDYRTRGLEDISRFFQRMPAGLERLDLAVKEWIGLLAYWLTGRTDALFPEPNG